MKDYQLIVLLFLVFSGLIMYAMLVGFVLFLLH